MALWYGDRAQPLGLAGILQLGQGKRYSALCILAVAKQSTFSLQFSIGHLRRVWKEGRKKWEVKWEEKQAPPVREDHEGSICSSLEHLQRSTRLLLELRKLGSLLHRGTEASIFLICSFKSLKKNKNGFLSPSTTTKCFIKPTRPIWRKEMTSDCKGARSSIWAYFSQSCHCLWRDARSPHLMFVNTGDFVKRMGLINWSWLCLLEIDKTKAPVSTMCPPPSCTICL